MSFVFSLGSVLRVRGMLEEQEERLLQKILFEITQTLEAITRADGEIAGSNASRRADIHKPVIGHDVHASYSQVAHFKQTKAELETRIEKLQKLRDQQQSRDAHGYVRREAYCIQYRDGSKRTEGPG